jgi:hypothetical protein
MVYEYKPEVYLCFYIMNEDNPPVDLDRLHKQSAILLTQAAHHQQFSGLLG